MIREPTKPSALDIEESFDLAKCRCEFAKFGDLLPVCKHGFNPNHPLTRHKNFACGNFNEDDELCGHARECHGDKP